MSDDKKIQKPSVNDTAAPPESASPDVSHLHDLPQVSPVPGGDDGNLTHDSVDPSQEPATDLGPFDDVRQTPEGDDNNPG